VKASCMYPKKLLDACDKILCERVAAAGKTKVYEAGMKAIQETLTQQLMIYNKAVEESNKKAEKINQALANQLDRGEIDEAEANRNKWEFQHYAPDECTYSKAREFARTYGWRFRGVKKQMKPVDAAMAARRVWIAPCPGMGVLVWTKNGKICFKYMITF